MNTKMWLSMGIMVVALGLGWLLTAKNVIEGVDWLGPILLATMGLLCVFMVGVDKLTVVAGPFLIIAGVCSVLRQTGKLDVNVEVPSLVIVLGLLMVVSVVSPVPKPPWYQELPPDDKGGTPL